MFASNNPHPHSPGRRHFVRSSAAFAAKLAGIAALASTVVPGSAKADHGHGGRGWGWGWGHGVGGGDGHCFLKGTRVLTSRGETQIEDLKVGDLVKTMRGDLPIKWIGRNTFRRSGAAWHESVVPIRVSRFAIDDQTPHADLYLSPGHCLYVGGFLMEVRDLVNGTSIAPAAPTDETIEYFHIVLNTQEVIWAEGAPAETFGGEGLDLFTNFVEYKRLYPDDPCAAIPFVAPNLSTAGAHLRALVGVGASYLVDVRNPLQEAYEQFAARGDKLAA